MGWTGFAGSIAGSIGGLLGGALDSHNDRELARMNSDFQREVYQNQYQWKVADAKKAGLHPLAVLGGGSYSASPISSGSGSNYAGALGKLGEGIGDAFNAYMTKDEMAAKAAEEDERHDMAVAEHKARIRESNARTSMYTGQALEAMRRSQSYTIPMASGNEVLKGQTDAHQPMLQKFVRPDGTLTNWKPSNSYQEVHSDIPLLEFWPHIQAAYQTVRDMLGSDFKPLPEPYLDRRYR